MSDHEQDPIVDEEEVDGSAPVEPQPEESDLAEKSDLAEEVDLAEPADLSESTDLPESADLPESTDLPEPDGEDVGTDEEPAAPVRTAQDISGPVEALLLLADDPISETSLAQTLDVPVAVVSECLAELVDFYDETKRGFELRHVGDGWRYYTRAEHADVITVSVLEGQQSRLSQAALETLAVVAYQQPISRGRISAVRGVNVDGVIRTLLARGLVDEAGADEDSGAAVFRTTTYFLERMGLKTLDDLPPLAPHLPEVDELEAELGQLAAVAEQPDGGEVAQSEPSGPASPAIAEPTLDTDPDSDGDPAPVVDPTSEVAGDDIATAEVDHDVQADQPDPDVDHDVAPVDNDVDNDVDNVVDNDVEPPSTPPDLTQEDANVGASTPTRSGEDQ